MITIFDHAYGFSPLDVDAVIGRLRAAGFLIDREDCVRHPGGQLNAFAKLTASYLELMTVVDEAEFERDAKPDERVMRPLHRPFGVVAYANDAEAVWRALVPGYPALEAPVRRAPQDQPAAAPLWSVLELPEDATPGAGALAVQYLFPIPRARVRFGPNTIYGFGGFWLCVDDPRMVAAAWHRTLQALAPGDVTLSEDLTVLALGPQEVRCLDPFTYRAWFGCEWPAAAPKQGAVCALRLLCGSLVEARAWLERGGFTLRPRDDRSFLALPDRELGLAFVVEERGSADAFVEHVNARRVITA